MTTHQEPAKVFTMASSTNRTIIRVAARNKEHPYVMIVRKTLQDGGRERLSLAGLGLLAYLLSKPDDWEVRVDDIMAQWDIGRDQAIRLIKELKRCGYVIQDRTRNVQGRWEPGQFYVYETPQEPHTENQ
jgi:hypothetical protein